MSTTVPAVLDLLVCPKCHAALTWAFEASELQCTDPACALAYPVRQGIPILLLEQARPIAR